MPQLNRAHLAPLILLGAALWLCVPGCELATDALSGVALASTASQRPKLALSEHAWRRRALLLITPHTDHAPTQAALDAIAARRDALTARDVLVYVLPARGDAWVEGDLSDDAHASVATRVALPATITRELRRAHQAKEADARLILIGKDGGSKQEQALPGDIHALIQTIDAMPMRLREARQAR